MLSRRLFTRYAWITLAINVLVILWGAVVRATGAGAGCGQHWPLCNGTAVPQAPQVKTLIEYGHRLTSGVALICVIGLVWLAFRVFPKGQVVRRTAVLSLVFEIMEALIGAGLVLLGHVAANQSIARAYSLAFHLTNTLLLLAALALTAWYSGESADGGDPAAGFRGVLVVFAVGLIAIGITGAIAALGDTLFASSSFVEGMRQDFSASAHPFVRLRILHPILAVVLGVSLVAFLGYLISSTGVTRTVKRLGIGLIVITCGQLLLGLVNLLLMAPVPLQIAHLCLADALWVSFVLLAAEVVWPRSALVVRRPVSEQDRVVSAT